MILTNEIATHILNQYHIKSNMINDEFLIEEKLKFIEDSKEISSNIYISNLTSLNQEIQILITTYSNNRCLIIKIKDSPSYAILELNGENSLIALKLDNWVTCSIYIQATFLAAMEQLKDLSILVKSSDINDEIINLLHEFLEYYEEINEQIN